MSSNHSKTPTISGNDKVTFLVGKEKIPIESRKSVLAKHSTVFKAMFYGDLREGDEIYTMKMKKFHGILQTLVTFFT